MECESSSQVDSPSVGKKKVDLKTATLSRYVMKATEKTAQTDVFTPGGLYMSLHAFELRFARRTALVRIRLPSRGLMVVMVNSAADG